MTIGVGVDHANAMVIDPQGRIVLVGQSSNGVDYDIGVARLLQDGAPDNTFGGDGSVMIDAGSWYDDANAVAVDADGGIIVAARMEGSGSTDMVVMRLNADGSLDSSFADLGKLVIMFGTGHDYPYALVLRPDGRILVIGSTQDAGTYHTAIAQLLPDGSYDPDYSDDGRSIIALSAIRDISAAGLLLPDGKLLLAATIGNPSDLGVARIGPDGELDVSFGIQGVATASVTDTNDLGMTIALAPDGRIVVAGSAQFGVFRRFAVARFTQDGTLDTSFNDVGYAAHNAGPLENQGSDVVVQPDGKIIVCGTAGISPNPVMGLLRYDVTGALDTLFDEDGKLVLDVGAYSDFARAIALQADGILIAGSSTALDGYTRFTVVRLLNDIDIGFADLVGASASIRVFPNPIAAGALFSFDLRDDDRLTLSCFDLQGRMLRGFFAGRTFCAGHHMVELDFTGIAPGSCVLAFSNGSGRSAVQVIKE